MSHDLLYDLQIGFIFTESCTKRMAQIMNCKVRYQNGRTLLFFSKGTFSFIIVVKNTCYCSIKLVCAKYIIVSIQENKIGISIYYRLNKILFILLFFQMKQSFSHRFKHWYDSHTGFGFRSCNMEFTASTILLAINKVVVNRDNTIFKITVIPSQTGQFPNPTTGTKKNRKYRSPMPIYTMIRYVVDECLLLRFS